MPRTKSPKLPDSELISKLSAQIEHLGWASIRSAISSQYQQRLDKIAAKNLTPDALKKARFKKLSQDEKIALALCFLHRLIELNQKGQDTETTIAELAQAETAFLEQGYTPEFIAKNLHPLYINLIRDAIDRGTIKLTDTNAYYLEVPDADTDNLIELQQHYAQLYLKYDRSFYTQLKRSVTQVNNLKQDSPQPVRLQPFLEQVTQLLNSDSHTTLAAGIAAASGRRFSEVIERGKAILPPNPSSPYEFLFSGQLKKGDDPEPYLTYSLVPAADLIKAIARFRSIPKIKSLHGASIAKINTLNPGVNYQVKKHFQDTGIISVLPGEAGVSIHNLRAAYGAISTHFFCPNPSQLPRFLSSKLGHLIGDELRDLSSASTPHYFHYYLIDEQDHQIDSMGVKLSESNPTPSKSRHAVLNIKADTKQLFKQQQQDMNTATENDTLLQLIERSDQIPHLMAQLAESQQQIERLHIKLANLESPPESEQITISAEVTVEEQAELIPTELPESEQTAPEEHPDLEDKETGQPEAILDQVPPNLMDAISSLVLSMSTLTSKFDLFFDQSTSTTTTSAQPKSTSTTPPPNRSAQTRERLNHVIDKMIEHNNQATDLAAKWRVSSSLLTQITASRPSIRYVLQSRQSQLEAHHQQHNITRLHNRSYHQHQQLSDFFDLDF